MHFFQTQGPFHSKPQRQNSLFNLLFQCFRLSIYIVSGGQWPLFFKLSLFFFLNEGLNNIKIGLSHDFSDLYVGNFFSFSKETLLLGFVFCERHFHFGKALKKNLSLILVEKTCRSISRFRGLMR